ncbi:MarR family winged helix-turn-helix transcriptional regulator [Nocardia sp. CDC160]|uniref:MarR family winged helix-turn-helix transcriptional regulator n=1 Tax=Nocardia sp. CDC160 TaxID=3112166 RepID=UPI002DBC4543|nr:MarR family transcriptional regulator [Nocardia sp. CDC160]MEC3915435.1 MarR family transcriptional regulator [Nocardia sp. CDC160]
MTELTAEDMTIWHACKTLGDHVTRRVAADITTASGMSGTDYGVLSRLAELGGGRLRQQVLTDSMGLHKGAMSHQLTRMQNRGLIRRERVPAGTDVVLTDQGTAALETLRPIHADAVRRHLLDRLMPEDRIALRRIATALAEAASGD